MANRWANRRLRHTDGKRTHRQGARCGFTLKGERMIVSDYIDAKGAEHCRIFYSFEDLHRATFSPACRIWDTVELKLHGKTYSERKEACAALAARVLKMKTGDLAYSEIQILRNYFQKYGAKTGNLKLFRRIGIL